MKRYLGVLVCAVLVSALAACGGTSSSSGSDDDLTSADISAISTAITQATNDVGDVMTDGGTQAELANKAQYNFVVSTQTNCQISGHITSSGNISVYVNEDTGDSSVTGQVTFQVSDPTNNLNDCEVANDIILDGTIYLTMSGTNSNVTMVIDGIIGINRRGEYGGLVPIADDCRIFVTYSGGSASGSICGRPVSS